MTSPEDDEPLDPAVERVRRRLARLLFVSSGVMLVGFAAVVIAILYRISRSEAPMPAAPVALEVPAADLLAAAVADDRLVLTLGGAAPRIELRRLSDGALLARYDLAR